MLEQNKLVKDRFIQTNRLTVKNKKCKILHFKLFIYNKIIY